MKQKLMHSVRKDWKKNWSLYVLVLPVLLFF